MEEFLTKNLKTEQFKFKKTNYACRTGFSLPFDYYINKIPIPLKHYSSSFLILVLYRNKRQSGTVMNLSYQFCKGILQSLENFYSYF